MKERPSGEGIACVEAQRHVRLHTLQGKEFILAGRTVWPHVMVQKVVLGEEKPGRGAQSSEPRT